MTGRTESRPAWTGWQLLLTLDPTARVLEIDSDRTAPPPLPSPPGTHDAALVAARPAADGVDAGTLLTALRGALRPGGSLALSLANPRARLFAKLAPAGFGDGPRGLAVRFRPFSPRALPRQLAAAGFDRVRVFAPLPSRLSPRFLVPLGEPRALRHFLWLAVPRQEGAARRLQLAFLRCAAVLGLFDQLVPGYEVLASVPEEV